MNVQTCVFCKIIAGQIPCTKVYENDAVLAFLDIGPISDGHTLVVPKAHTPRVDKTDSHTMAALAQALPMLADAVQQAVGADGYNILCNNGLSAGQIVEHVHLHIVPRKKNDGLFNQWPSFQYPQGKAGAIAEKIIQNLNLSRVRP
ncbi:MAG: HIT family protein [Planctomycetales bacterium]|nr:HIT family protein [Planctomycetales bacterium]